jgi:chromosome segregation ATPase
MESLMQEESVRLALLERNQENVEKELKALREAISEISKTNVKISELLAVHQVKIDQQQQREESLNKKVETGISRLMEKMDTDRNQIDEKMNTIQTEIKGIRDKVFIGVGIVLFIQLIIMVFGAQLISVEGKALTNSDSSAKIQGR